MKGLLHHLGRLYLSLPDYGWKQPVLRYVSARAGTAVFPSRHGVRLRNRPGDYTFAVAVLGRGDFVEAVVREQAALRNFLDIGANQGLFSLIAARAMRKAGTPGRVVSIEPNPFVFASLCENLTLNRVPNAMPLCTALVRDEARLRQLSYRPHHSGGGSLKKALGREVTVLCANHALLDEIADAVPGGFLVKIDVEGLEGEVLEAIAGSRLAGRVEGVIVELHPRHNSAEEIEAVTGWLARLGLSEVARSSPSGRCDAYFARVAGAGAG